MMRHKKEKRHESFNYKPFQDEIVEKSCDNCNLTLEDRSDEIQECPRCEGELINTTILEKEDCAHCGAHLGMWADYVWKHVNKEKYICDDCLEKL